MSDQTWAIIAGVSSVVLVRLLDWAFPKGWVWRQAIRWSQPPPEQSSAVEAMRGDDDDGK